MTNSNPESSCPPGSPLSSEQQLRAILECANDIIFAIAPDGIITFVSSSFQTVTGWLPADWVGKPFRPLVHPADVLQAEQSFAAALAGQGVGSVKVRVI